MIKKLIFIVGLLSTLLLTACVFPIGPQLTPLQLQSIQSNAYQGVAKRALFNATVTSFQDSGYILRSADFDTGFISAGRGDLNISAFVTGSDDSSSLRINMERNYTSAENGLIVNRSRPIYDPQVYQNFFNLIRHNLFAQGVLS